MAGHSDRGPFVSVFNLLTLVIFFLSLILVLIPIPTARAKDKTLIWCCRGWSDDLSPSIPASSRVDTTQTDGLCAAERECSSSSTTDCAVNWQAEKHSFAYPNGTNAECADPPKSSRTCSCETDWCNCPQELKGFKTPLPKKGLTCCYGSSTFQDEIETARLSSDPAIPCVGRVKNNFSEWQSGEIYIQSSRLREDCFKWDFRSFQSNLGDICRCHTDLCNCPARIKNNETGKAKANTTNGSPQLRTGTGIQTSNLTSQLIFLVLLLAFPTSTLMSMSVSMSK